MRVYEYAKQCGLKTKELLRILEDEGIYNKTFQSNITPNEIDKIKSLTENIIQDKIEEVNEPVFNVNSVNFYDVSKLIEDYPDDNYYIVMSPRNLGKTTNGCLLCLWTYCVANKGCPSVLIRRQDVDIEGGKLGEMWGEIVSFGYVSKWTNNKYNNIKQVGSRCYLCKTDEDGKIVERDKNFFMYAIPLNTSGNYKGLQLNKSEESIFVRYIIYDEIIPQDGVSYLPREDTMFFNTVSTVVRKFKMAKIILFGNTISGLASPILTFMGIDIYSFDVGEIREYSYEYKGKKNRICCHMVDKSLYPGVYDTNNEYFIFNNQSISSITGENSDEYGVWEISKNFNSLPRKYKPSNVVFTFYWTNVDEILQGDVVYLEDCRFIFNHKTGHKLGDGWLDEDNNLIFSQICDPRPNWICKIMGSNNKKVKKIYEIIREGRCFFQNAWLSSYWENLIKNM